ncbi:MAG: endolytic transglycosylase MltG, partial [Luteitalea sp.]|nr:endolytic transglycosylase MltG [Luteitalea sp.]
QSVRHDAGSSLGLREVVTLASIIERETQSAAERALVAAVYHNRLTRGMILQADPTVIYALARAGSYKGRLSRQDLRFDSAYNTYRYAGLPPGPIGSPGLAALEAAINPAAVDFLFFVSRNDGTHAFSRTPEEHNDNVYRFQVLPFRDKPRPGKTANPRARPADAGEASGGSGH